MNPCFKKDLGHAAISGKKLDKTPLGKGGGDTIDLRTRKTLSTQHRLVFNRAFFFMFLYLSY